MTISNSDLAARAKRGELKVKPGTVRRGAASRDEVRNQLVDATGASTLEEAIEMAIGRPPAGTDRGESPVIRARVPKELKDAVRALAAYEHRRESDIVREAVAAYVQMHAAS